MIPPLEREAASPHSGREQKRNLAADQQVGDPEDRLPAEIDVENGNVEIHPVLRQLGRFLDIVGRPDDLAPSSESMSSNIMQIIGSSSITRTRTPCSPFAAVGRVSMV